MKEKQSLSDRQKSIVTIAAFTASGNLEKLRTSLNKGLDSGLTVNEIKEILVQMYAYAGFPRSLNGIATFMEVQDECRAKGIKDEVGKEAGPPPRELYAQLPLKIAVENYRNKEKIFYPPKKLNTADTPQADAGPGTLAYNAPWGDVVMFYGSFGSAPGLYKLGKAISGSEHIQEISGNIRVERGSVP